MKDSQTNNTSFSVNANIISLSGSLRGGGTKQGILTDLTRALRKCSESKIEVNLSQVTELDGLGASLLAEFAVRGRTLGHEIVLTNAPEHISQILDRYFSPTPEIHIDKEKSSLVVNLGDRFQQFWESLGELLLLISESVYWTIVGMWNPRGHRKGAVGAQALAIGVGALPVILLISFLIGIVLALQSAAQLRQFGANIFVANLIVVAMAREMGPLMTAILLAGRSGASIAAEISSMTVNEEIDALRTMALNPIRYVVVPKILGITITAPLLSIMATIIGIFGGYLVAISTLDLSTQSFLNQAVNALFLKDIITGLIKSYVFAWLIVILAAYNGFRVTGGSEGVGRATTRAVVASIFAVIVADACLGLLFYL